MRSAGAALKRHLRWKAVKRIAIQTTSHRYDVLLESGLLARAGGLLRSRLRIKGELIIVVSSPTVWDLWGSVLSASLDGAKLRWQKLLVEDGEPAKTLTNTEEAAEQLVTIGADRSSVLVAFGGGVVGDLAGFLAAIYMRGIPFVQVPSTLLAQVDASIGGKTGVNLNSGKNLIGSFHQPALVLLDPSLLTTLPAREFRAGLFEVLKAGIIADATLFELMECEARGILACDARLASACIEAAIRIKANVVSRDEKESGLRRILNFGHTLGHALETETQYQQFVHGEAVAWGMIAAALIGVGLRRTSSEAARRIVASVLSYGPLPPVHASAAALISRLSSDKKSIGGKNLFVLATEIGATTIAHEVPSDIIARAIEQVRRLSV